MGSSLDRCNQKLTRVKLLARGKYLSIRGRLPDSKGKVERKTISLGIPNTPEGLKVAFAKAQQIEIDLIYDRYGIEEKNNLTVLKAIDLFEQDFWGRKEKTKSRADNYKEDYLRAFLYLPQDEILTEDLLKRALLTTEPDSRQRLRFAIAYNALARVNGIKADLNRLKGNYEPKTIRQIPTEDEIEKYWESIPNPAWRWVFGIVATFGIRPHEIFFLDISKLTQHPPILQIGEETKTKFRLVYPIPASDWVEKWELPNLQFPNIKTENLSNRSLGTKIGQGFNRYKIPSPYHFRDAYAIRGVLYNFNPSLVAKWMGHSLDVHEKKYLRHMQEKHFNEAWEKQSRIFNAKQEFDLRLSKDPTRIN